MAEEKIRKFNAKTLFSLGFTLTYLGRFKVLRKEYEIKGRIFTGIVDGDNYYLDKFGYITRPLDIKLLEEAWELFFTDLSQAATTPLARKEGNKKEGELGTFYISSPAPLTPSTTYVTPTVESLYTPTISTSYSSSTEPTKSTKPTKKESSTHPLSEPKTVTQEQLSSLVDLSQSNIIDLSNPENPQLTQTCPSCHARGAYTITASHVSPLDRSTTIYDAKCTACGKPFSFSLTAAPKPKE